jgi:hypothetical protein
MHSVNSSVKRWNTTATRVAVVIIFALQGLCLRAGWPQEPAQPPPNEEFVKQDKIYHSRGTEVPEGYVTNRGLSDYADQSFVRELDRSGFIQSLYRK